MKKVILYVFVCLLYGVSLSQSVSKPTPKNQEIVTLQKVNANYQQLCEKVNQMTASLSQIEKDRAAFFLVSVYSLVIESYVEKGNPANPMLTYWMAPPRKFAGDNPYTIYTQAPVNANCIYKLSGKKGNAIYLGLQVYGYQSGFNLPTANIGLANIVFNENDSFEIYLSETKPEYAKNWLPIKKGDHAFLVRQYFNDRNNIVPSELKIERIDHNSYAGTTYLERLQHANKMITEYILGTIDINNLLRENAFNHYSNKEAQVRQPKYGGALYPTKDNIYEGCWVSLKKGEAFRVHGFLPQHTLYASYVFYDRWYNTLSYPTINCFRTKNEIVLNADSSFDLYISPEKIDHPNWINTGGLYEGSYSSRYLESIDKVFPSVEVVKIKDIAPFK